MLYETGFYHFVASSCETD